MNIRLMYVSLTALAVIPLLYLVYTGDKFYTKPWLYLKATFKAECDGVCVERDLNNTKKPLYKIYTNTCKVPYVDTYHPSIAAYKVKKPFDIGCSEKQPLTENYGLKLYLYPDRAWQYGLGLQADLNCSYQGIIRVTQDPKKYDHTCDRKVRYTDEVILNKRVTHIEDDGIYVICKDMTNSSKIFYKNVHHFIQPRRAEKKRKIQEKKGPRGSQPDQLSVVIMGLDATARNNFVRNMPKSFHYITQELNAVDMMGYNKIGWNTYPNVAPLLTGLRDNELKVHPCLPKHSSKFDDCPFLFKNMSSHDYVTVFAEDAPWMGSFRYTRVGFVLEPTDYYDLPYFMVSDEKIGNHGAYGGNGYICQGGKMSSAVIYDYALSVSDSLQDVPYFAYYWMAAITHDSMDLSSAADAPLLEYLKKMHNGGYFEHTILILMGDHGLHYTSSLNTYAGKLEVKMPVMMIVLPQWFKDKYPEATNNLEINKNRLSMTLDIHATIQDIGLRGYTNPDKSFVGELFGQSLFKKIPLERTCQNSGIAHNICSCQEPNKIELNNPVLLGSVKHTLEVLNKGLKKFPSCKELTLGKVLKGLVHSAGNNTLPRLLNTVQYTYDATFTAEPGAMQLESSTLFDNFTQTYALATEVTRLNFDEGKASCIKDKAYKKFCFCKS